MHRGLRAATERSLLLARAVPLRPLDPRHPRRAQARRDAGADRRGHRQGRRSASPRSSPSSGSRSGTRRRRSSRCWRSTGSWSGTTTPRCAWCCSPARSSRSSICARLRAAARSRATSTSTARPKRTSAPSTRSGAGPRGSRRRRTRSAMTCSHLRCKVVDARGTRRSPRGEEGELCVAGRGVMQGYWALPEQTARAFLVDDDGARWYKTGDIVTEDAGRQLHLPRPARPDGQAPRLSRRARRDRGRRSIATRRQGGGRRRRCRTRRHGVKHHGLPQLPRREARRRSSR